MRSGDVAESLRERLSVVVSGLPDEVSLTFPVATLRGWIEEFPEDVASSARNGEEDSLLTVERTAEILAVDRSWIYRHADSLPFTRRLTSGTLRFSSQGLQTWLKTRRTNG